MESSIITKTCRTCGLGKPLSDFYLSNGYPQADCKKCANKRRTEADRKLTAARKEAAAASPAEPCRHSFRLCGDASILQCFPAFYRDHKEADVGEEWQVCKDCGDAKLVRVYEPTGDDKRLERVLSQTREPRPVAAARDENGNGSASVQAPVHVPVAPFRPAEYDAGELKAQIVGLETDLDRSTKEILRLQSQLELQTAYAEKWRKRANRLAEKLELIELRRENEELRRQVATSSGV